MLLIIFLLKSFMVKCFESLLTRIPPSKVVSALKKNYHQRPFEYKVLFPTVLFSFSEDIAKNITNFLFWRYFEIIWLFPSKTIIPTCRKFDVILHVKKSTPYIISFRDIVKILQTCYFE